MGRTVIADQMYFGQKGKTAGRKSPHRINRTGTPVGTTKVNAYQKAAKQHGQPAHAGMSEPVKYDVSDGSRRVAQIMNDEPYLADQAMVYGKREDVSYAADAKAVAEADATLEEEIAAEEEAASTEETAGKEKKTSGYTEEDVNDLERMLERLKESRANQKKNTTKKKLNYNHKRISSAIRVSKTPQQASNALKSAKTVLSDLKRKFASQQYSDDEIEIAITHANKMIRAARRKVSHLKQEQQQDRFDEDAGQNKERKNKRIKQEMKDQVDPKKLDVKLDEELRMLKKRLKQITNSEKNGHRRNEDLELLEADMEYLKKKIDLMQQEQNQSGTQSTGQESVSGESAPVSADTQTAIAADNASQIESTAGAEQAISDISAGSMVDVSV